MALVLKDRVKETTTSTGTGTITLAGAVVGYQSFSAIGNSNTTYYTIQDTAAGTWEVGIGTYTASGTTLARTTVLSSSNAGSLVNFGAGTKDVFVTYPSEFSNTAQIGDVVLATGSPSGPGAWLEAGKYYSKATYPELATKLGSVADFGPVTSAPQAKIPAPYASPASVGFSYLFASNGTTAVVVGQNGAIFRSTDGLDWTPVASQATSNFLSVTHLSGNFVAVGASVCTSTDGTTWVNRFTPLADIRSAAFGNSTYVLVGNIGAIAYSSNLTSWTQLFVGTQNFNKVIFANSLFVAVGNTGALFTSPNGITWTSRSAGSLTFNDVIYANSLFVAVGSGGAVYTSSDGATWTNRSAGSSPFYEVIFANSLFVAVGGTSTLYTSTDGTTWTSRTIPQTGISLAAVDWNGSNFVAVSGNFGGYYFTSPTGTTWTAVRDASCTQFFSVFVFSGKTIALGNTSSVVLAGATRTEVLQGGTWNFGNNTPANQNFTSLAYNGSNQYVVVGNLGVILTSSDGTLWTGQVAAPASTPTTLNTLNSVSHLNGNYVVTSVGNGVNLFTSPDGITWTPRSAGSAQFNASAFGASTYVVVGEAGNVYSSTDLVTWTSRSAGSTAFRSIIYANSLFVAVGETGVIYTSADGATWTSRGGATGQTFIKIIYANSLFVVVGTGGVIFTSSDGITWTAQGSGVGEQLQDVVWSGSVFCAVGSSGVITTSPNGVTWTARTPGDTSVNLMNISWDGSKFLASAINSGGSVWTSPDGITWTRVGTTTTTATRYSAYLGGRFIAVATIGHIQTSTDGFTWTASTNVQYVPTGGSKIYKLGGNYYVLSTQGMFQSTDGVSFSPVRQSISATQAGMAYSGSVWLMVTAGATGLPGAVYRSTNGTTWVKSAEFNTRTTASSGAGAIADVAYANGNFILGIAATANQGIANTIYTSSNGLTWTARQLPYNGTPSLIASDGTTAATTSSGILFKSTNGGVTWTSVISTTAAPVTYSNGAWVLNAVASYFTSPDLSTFYSTGITAAAQIPAGIHVSGDYITGAFTANTMLFNKKSNGYVQIPNNGGVIVTYTFSGLEIPVRSTTGLFLVTRTAGIHPTIVAERPLYSYDTATTFWIPPSNAGAGQKAYVYAGA
jgi:hypothetical protein